MKLAKENRLLTGQDLIVHQHQGPLHQHNRRAAICRFCLPSMSGVRSRLHLPDDTSVFPGLRPPKDRASLLMRLAERDRE